MYNLTEYIKAHTKKKKWDRDKDWVSYSGPYFDEKEHLAIINSILDQWYIFGPKGREFEKKFAPHLGHKDGIFVNSGSSANLLMFEAARSDKGLGLKGGKIITPVVAFPTTLNPIIQTGFEPVFVDVEIPSLNLDLDQVEWELQRNDDVVGICFAHVLGNPPDMDRLMFLVNKYNVYLFEDTCDALGSSYDGKLLGSFGIMSTCSFFPAHHMTTGEGGFVATSDWRLRRVLSSLRDWGRACFCNTQKPGCVTEETACGYRFGKWLPGLPDVIYDHRYVFENIGYNLKPLELQAAIGLEQLKKLPEMEFARGQNFNRLYSIFEKYGESFHLPSKMEKAEVCWFAFPLIVKDVASFTRQNFVDHLEKNRIQTRPYFCGNVLAHPAYQHLKGEMDLKKCFPNSITASESTFFLGTYIGIDNEQLQYIEEVVDKFFK